MTRMRNGRNSKVMLFNHEQGPKTVSPISLNDDTTTENAKVDDEAITIKPAETSTLKKKENIDDTFQAKLGLDEESKKEDSTENKESSEIMETSKKVGDLLADLEKAIAQVDADYEEDLKQIEKLPLKSLESEDIGEIENDLADELIAESLQKDRLPKDHESKFDIEHNFSLDDDIQEDARSANPEKNTLRKGDVELAESPILQIKQQPNVPQEQFSSGNPAVSGQSQFQAPQQGFNRQNQFPSKQVQGYNNRNNFPAQVQQQGFNPYRNQQFGNSQQQYNQNVNPALYNNQNTFSQGFNGQNQFQQFGNQQQFYSQATPRQIEDNQAGASLLNDFGDAMGPDASVDPERNQFSSQPQLNPRQQAGDDNDTPLEDEKAVDEEVRCINKVMQVEETVYDKVIKCQHTFTEKCHDTFITDYVPTQERKCNDVRVPVPESTRFLLRRNRRQAVDDNGAPALTDDTGLPPLAGNNGLGPGGEIPQIEGNQLESLSDKDLLSIGDECEDWPVQKCELVKKVVKKVNPETSCQKMPREICAPGNCVVKPSEKKCRKEKKSLVQNIP